MSLQFFKLKSKLFRVHTSGHCGEGFAFFVDWVRKRPSVTYFVDLNYTFIIFRNRIIISCSIESSDVGSCLLVIISHPYSPSSFDSLINSQPKT